MTTEPAMFGWWGEEGGHRLDVKCWRDGKLELTVTTAHQPPSTVTLANFRALRFWQWVNENSDVPTEPVPTCLDCWFCHQMGEPSDCVRCLAEHPMHDSQQPRRVRPND